MRKVIMLIAVSLLFAGTHAFGISEEKKQEIARVVFAKIDKIKASRTDKELDENLKDQKSHLKYFDWKSDLKSRVIAIFDKAAQERRKKLKKELEDMYKRLNLK